MIIAVANQKGGDGLRSRKLQCPDDLRGHEKSCQYLGGDSAY